MQLDFISYGQAAKSEQFNLFADDLKAASKPKATIIYSKAEKFFQSLDRDTIEKYKTYWASVTPSNDSERFQRFLFALMSVRTSWENNIRGYQAIKNWIEWFNSPDKLKSRLIESGVGLFNNRTRFVDAFSKQFWMDIKKFNKLSSESWREYRNRLEKDILGLGLAKTSFALEMIAPNDCEVFCADTHLFQLYGLDQSRDSAHYEAIESHWVSMSKMYNCPSYIARCIWWDANQQKQDSRYWSWTLETDSSHTPTFAAP